MKLIISNEKLIASLQKVQGVATGSGSQPILASVLLEADAGKLVISATSLSISIRESVEAGTVEESGAVCVNAKKLFDIVKELPEDSLKITVDEKFQTKLTCGKSTFKLTGLDKKEFPAIPDVNALKSGTLTIETAALIRMLKGTTYAVADTDSRIGITGALLMLTQNGTGIKSRLVGTDGHRLAMLDGFFANIKVADKVRVVIPKRALQEIRKFVEGEAQTTVEIGFTEGQVIVKRGEGSLFAKLLDASYPNYQQVVPSKTTTVVTVSRATILGTLKRVSLLAKNYQVALEVKNNEIQLSTQNPETGEANETIGAKVEGPGLKIGFNHKFVQDALSNIDSENVVMKFNDVLSPCVVTGENDTAGLCVLMPMRL